MKLSVPQIVLGVLIVFACCYVTGWMIFRAPDQSIPTTFFTNETGRYFSLGPEHETLFNVSRYGSYLLPFLGVSLLIIGTVRVVKSGVFTRRFAAVDIIIGVVLAGLAVFIVCWGYPTTFLSKAVPGSDDQFITIIDPGRGMIGPQLATGAIILFSVIVLGAGITRLVKSRKSAIS
ncbi:MAG: hypothetical protein WC370_08815 [Dehalococcoidales bacterium]